MLTLFPRIRPNPLPPPLAPPVVPKAPEASEAMEAATTVAADAPLVDVSADAAVDPAGPLSGRSDSAADSARVSAHAEPLQSAVATELAEPLPATPAEAFVVEISDVPLSAPVHVAPEGEAPADDASAASAATEHPPDLEASTATAAAESASAADQPASRESASTLNSSTLPSPVTAAEIGAPFGLLARQSDGANTLIVAGTNIFDELDILHEAATENSSAFTEAPVAPAEPEPAAAMAELGSDHDAATKAVSAALLREPIPSEVEPTAESAALEVATPATIEIEWDEKPAAAGAPAPLRAESPSAEAAAVDHVEPSSLAAFPEANGTPPEKASESTALAVSPADASATEDPAASALPREAAAEAAATQSAAAEPNAPMPGIAEAGTSAQSGEPDHLVEEILRIEAAFAASAHSHSDAPGGEAAGAAPPQTAAQAPTESPDQIAATREVKVEGRKPVPVMPRKPKRSKESAFELMRVPEPEAMDDSEEVEAYASAAAQAHLDAIDDTFVAHAQLLLKGRERGRALDIGTGPGQIAIKLGYRLTRWKFTGIDRSAAMVEKARQNLESAPELAGRVEFRTADGNSLDFPDATFDLVICNSVLHHMEEPQNLFSEIARVVKPDGAILLRDLRRPRRFGYRAHIRKNGKHYAGEMRRLYIASLHAAYTEEELQKMVAASALRNVTVFTHNKTHIGIQRAIGAPAIQKRK
jgi:ubiquinone/menaquinone biosynthesis C-methylase UbiE